MIKRTKLAVCIATASLITGCGSTDFLDQKNAALDTKSQLEDIRANQSNLFVTAPPTNFAKVKIKKAVSWTDSVPVSMNTIDVPLSVVMQEINRRLKTVVYWGRDTNSGVKVRVNVNGTLSDLIASIENQTEYKLDTSVENTISVLAWETKTLSLFNLVGQHDFLIGKNTATDITEGQDTSAESSSGALFNADQDQFANIKATVSSEIKDAVKVIESMMGEKNVNGQVHPNIASGTLTVTTKPRIMRDVENYVKQLNAMFGQMVRIDVQIITFQSNLDNSFGVDWNMVRETTKGTLNFTIPSSGETSGLTFASTDKLFNGSTALVNALKTQGNVSLVTTPSMLAINNRVGEIESLRKEAYVKDITMREATNEDSSTYSEVNQGVVSEGFSMRALVKIDGDEVLMQMSATISRLGNFGTVEMPTITLKTPNMSEDRFNQPLKIQNGRTVILSGYTQSAVTSEQSESFRNPLLGGNSGKERKSHTLVLVTPRIIR